MAYQQYLLDLVHHKTNATAKDIAFLWKVFVETILDCLASDGWLEIPNFGRIVIKKFAPRTVYNPFAKKVVTIDPKPYLQVKLRKPAHMYLNKKLQELGVDWSSIVYRSHKRGGKNMPPKLLQWFKDKDKRQELGIDLS